MLRRQIAIFVTLVWFALASPLPAQNAPKPVRVTITDSYIGQNLSSTTRLRFFATRLQVTNDSAEPITVRSDEIRLLTGGRSLEITEPDHRLQQHSFTIGDRPIALADFEPEEELTIEPGETEETWLLFAGLGPSHDVPAMRLRVPVAGQTLLFDVNAHHADLLKLQVERIGPRENLAIVTLGGPLDTINAGTLAETLHELSLDRVTRAVIRWDADLPDVEASLLAWLVRSAQWSQGNHWSAPQFPLIPTSLRELHLAEIPNDNYEIDPPETMRIAVHETTSQAVSAALWTSWLTLSRETLLDELQQGDPLSTAAMLRAAGDRLGPDQLPLILEMTKTADKPLQQAAVAALRHFRDPQAVQRLTQLAGDASDPLGPTAHEALVRSVAPQASQAVRDIFRKQSADQQRRFLKLFGDFPRREWGELLVAAATQGLPESRLIALRSLQKVGDPQMQRVMKQAIAATDDDVRSEALRWFISQDDTESSRIALEATLEWLETEPPTTEMMALLDQMRDQRAIPLLAKYLVDVDLNRAEIIQLLLKLADDSVEQILVDHFKTFDTIERAAVLGALLRLRSPRFYELAEQSLQSEQDALVRAAQETLARDGTEQAVTILQRVLLKSKDPEVWSAAISSLELIASPTAKQTLRAVRDVGPMQRQKLAADALADLRRQLPVYELVAKASQQYLLGQYDSSIDLYAKAIKIDPELPEAFAGRGHVLLIQSKPDAAFEDFRKAYELDPFISGAATGMAIVMAQRGQVDEAVRLVGDNMERFEDGYIFHYNVACVYGRAIEHLSKLPDGPSHEERIAKLERKAIDELKESIDMGYGSQNPEPDFEHMRKDPDLASLRSLDEFRTLARWPAQTDAEPQETDQSEPPPQ